MTLDCWTLKIRNDRWTQEKVKTDKEKCFCVIYLSCKYGITAITYNNSKLNNLWSQGRVGTVGRDSINCYELFVLEGTDYKLSTFLFTLILIQTLKSNYLSKNQSFLSLIFPLVNSKHSGISISRQDSVICSVRCCLL